MVYKEKHLKKNPRKDKLFFRVLAFIKEEVVFFISFWGKLIIKIPSGVAKLIDIHDNFWDKVDDKVVRFFSKIKEEIEDLKN